MIPVIRQQLARLYTIVETMRFLGYRVHTATSRGEQPWSGEFGAEAGGVSSVGDDG